MSSFRESEEAEGEDGEDGEPKPKPKKKKDTLKPLRKAIEKAEKLQAKSEGVLEKATKAEEKASFELDVQKQALEVIVESSWAISADAVFGMRHTLVVPQATYHVLKAVLLLLGRSKEEVVTWQRALGHVDSGLFQAMAEYDATQERDMHVWSAVRSCYKVRLAMISACIMSWEAMLLSSSHNDDALPRKVVGQQKLRKAAVAVHVTDTWVACGHTEKVLEA